MDSPQNIGDTTTASIASQLHGTHLKPSPAASAVHLSSAVYSGQKFIQLTLASGGSNANSSSSNSGSVSNSGSESTPGSFDAVVLRRVQDSYVNVSQMLHVLVLLGHYTQQQVDAYLANEVYSNPQYTPEAAQLPLFNDFTSHDVPQVRGLWIPYDKAVQIAVRFDVYKLFKALFLLDVHDYDKLPRDTSHDRPDDSAKRADSFPESPTKRQKTSTSDTAALLKAALAANANHPFTMPPLTFDDADRALVSDAKLRFSEIFKLDEKESLAITHDDIAARFQPIFDKCAQRGIKRSAILDVSLDSLGKTALHYAATLASSNLVGGFIKLDICSPIRGDTKGESPLLSTIQVTNAMEKGNFSELLGSWLWPNLWLFDNKNQSFLHYLISSAPKNMRSSKFYLTKILDWLISNPNKEQNLNNLCNRLINAQETQTGNTALHLAGELELKWFVFLLLELNADSSLANNVGVKPTDFECVNQVIELRNTYRANPDSASVTKSLLEALDADSEQEEYTLSLVKTGVDFLKEMEAHPEVGEMEDEIPLPKKEEKELTPTSEVQSSSLLSNKIFKSIQDLLANTNEEYEKVIHSKKIEINNLNKELRDATIVTANNKFLAKSITAKISQIDSMKLQMSNLNDKLQMLKKELPNGEEENIFSEAEDETPALLNFDADEPFIIHPIYEKLLRNEEVEPTPEILEQLPPAEVLKARLKAYEEVNSKLQKELDGLVDYSVLTAKFKKVVSFCTGVDINEVDDLLDGLLEAVEGQQ